jgi:hypothetical protein
MTLRVFGSSQEGEIAFQDWPNFNHSKFDSRVNPAFENRERAKKSPLTVSSQKVYATNIK